ncbi:hypothetical protein BP6252_04579 [Coleophoma cylindrospora]|uniref:GmrSD restriction endonucleases N-terminal domain-containing protein n=1 Tax=Coleophoma cylindrospora TaxID=1849047 RepID=A0A3D8S1H9_9HELO|nr:hypothetical protein BP6252_04579 [Coleophoma cylindrospora]
MMMSVANPVMYCGPEARIMVKPDPDMIMGPSRPVRRSTSRKKDGTIPRTEPAKAIVTSKGSTPSNTFVEIPKLEVKSETQDDQSGVRSEDDDPFDDFEYVDDNYEGVAEDEEGTEYFVCKEMKIPQVPKAEIFMRRLGDLYKLSKTKYMDLEPEYQREVVWDEHRASELIKSIFIGYFIPPLIFNLISKTEKDECGKKVEKYYRVCVDGKQRMTSVVKFMDGLIGFYDSSHPPKKWFYSHPIINGVEKITNHNIMPEVMKKRFRESQFCCYEYDNLNLTTEETMFQLVQRGIALTPAERMKAMSTEWAQFTKRYEEDYCLVVNLSKQNRASGFRVVLTIFTMIQEVGAHAENTDSKKGMPTLQSSPQALSKVLDDKKPISEALKSEFKDVFDKFEALVKQCSTKLPSGAWKINRDSPFDPAPEFLREDAVNHVKTYSPLELLATGILIAKYMGERSDELLLGDIQEMRHFLREKHKDLRVNAQCWISTWDFLDHELLLRRGGPGGTPLPDIQRQTSKPPSPPRTDSENEGSVEGSSKRVRQDGAANGETNADLIPSRPKRSRR